MGGKSENKLKQRLIEKNRNSSAQPELAPVQLSETNNHAALFKRLKESTSEKVAERLERDNKVIVYRVNIYSLEESPVDWNYFCSLSNDKMIELVESIKSIGLQSPIVVWELPCEDGEEQKYRILSGHNRTRAYKKIYETEKNDEYLQIPCIIYKQHELSEQEARDIIVDSNYVNRVLSTREKALSVKHKYLYYKSNKERGVIEKVANDLSLKMRTICYYLSINQLDNEIQELVYNDVLTMRDASKLAKLSMETQKWLVENHKDKITNEFCSKIKSKLSTEEIEKIIDTEGKHEYAEDKKIYTEITIQLPVKLEKEFKDMVALWLKQKQDQVED